MSVAVIPAILTDESALLQSQLDRIAKETRLGCVQIDIVDGLFADTVTIAPIDLLDYNLHGLSVDIHLMTDDPINDVVECSQIPGIRSIIAQIEHMPSQRAFIDHVKSYGLLTGFAIDRYTSPEAIDQESYRSLDIVQVMGVSAGAQGQEFGGEAILEKIRTIVAIPRLLARESFSLYVDGGVNDVSAASAVHAGADGVVVGSYLWNSADLSRAVEALQ